MSQAASYALQCAIPMCETPAAGSGASIKKFRSIFKETLKNLPLLA